MTDFNPANWSNAFPNVGAQFADSFSSAMKNVQDAQKQQVALQLQKQKQAAFAATQAALSKGDWQSAAAAWASAGGDPSDLAKIAAVDAPKQADDHTKLLTTLLSPVARNGLTLIKAGQVDAAKSYFAQHKDEAVQLGADPNAIDAVIADPTNPASMATLQRLAESGMDQHTANADAVAQQNANTDTFKAHNIIAGRGDTLLNLDANGKPNPAFRSPYADQYYTDPGVADPTTAGGVVSAPSAPAATTAPSSAGTNAAAPAGGSGGFQNAVQTVLGHEGGYAAHDMNGAPVNFGINQKANPDVNVAQLTKDQAIQIYHDRYWVPSGAENLPANLQAPYFDVYIRNPKVAKAALQRSGGDPSTFMQLSDNYFTRLGQTPNGQKYANAWANRDAHDLSIATGGAGASGAAGSPAQASGTGDTVYGGGFVVHNPGSTKETWSTDGHGNLISSNGDRKKDPTAAPETDPSTLDQAATDYRKWGKMPALGNGNGALRQQIIARDAQNVQRLGLTPSQASYIPIAVKSDQQLLDKNQKWAGQLQGSAEAVKQHSNTVLDAWQKVDAQTQSGTINSVVQGVQHEFGYGALSAAQSATKEWHTEMARVLTAGPSGNGQLSDAARQEFSVLESNAPYTAKVAAVKVLNQMADQKIAAVSRTNDAIQSRISGPIDTYAVIAKAHEAIARGADPAKVRARLAAAGISDVGL